MQKQVSCVVPARNEAGHLQQVIEAILNIPEIGEIVIVEGGSSDETYEVAEGLSRKYLETVKCLRQLNRGKMDAVFLGMRASRFPWIVIWDADGTVPPVDVHRLIKLAIEEACFAKGDRLRGNIAKGAMQPINYLGNWFFGLLWAPFLKERPTDVLCGSKVFPRRMVEYLDENLVNRDPYGDFVLLYCALKAGYRVRSIPVDYVARSYGASNISRWSGAFKLLLFIFWVYRTRIQERMKS